MRRHDERLLTAVHLRITIDTVDSNLRKAVERIGIKDQRHIKLQQARNHLHGTGRRCHAGTAQYAAVLLCNLAHGHTRSGTKRAAGIGRNSKNRNRGKRHTNKIGTRIGRRDSHIAGARAGSRLGGHNGSAGILRRTGNNKDGTARILIDIRGQRSKEIHQVTGLDYLGGMVNIIDDLIKAIIEATAYQITGVLWAISAVEANLGRDHRDRTLGTDAVVIDNTGLGIQTRRNIDRHHMVGAVVNCRNPDGERCTQVTVETGTKNSVNNNVGFIDQNLKLISRGTDAHMYVTTGGTAGNMASQSGRDLIRLNRRHDVHVNALVTQDISRDPAIATVVAKTDQNKDAIGIEF